MDCQTARLLVGFCPSAREIKGDEAEALESHLAGCPECGPFAQGERSFQARMSQAMRQVPIPEGLQLRILARLKAERGDYYRRWIGHSTRAVLATAALFLISWLIWSLFQKPPPNLDLDDIHQAMFAKINSPDKEHVEQWFGETYHANIVAPTGFNYAFLVDYDLSEFQGKRVPMLLFVHEQVTARVFVISSKEYNFANLPTGANISSGGFTVEVWHPPGADYAYVIVFTGDSLDPVRDKTQAPAA
ncbi:MAG: anti-sigma factor family protein [Gemmataceae bacterium]